MHDALPIQERYPESRCPQGEAFDWADLLAHRFDPSLPEPPEWPEAEGHLEVCNACRHLACALDPTLAFRNLPEISIGDADVEAMKQGVKVLRRSRKLLSEDREGSAVAGRTGRERQNAWRAAAAMALVVALGVLLSDLPQESSEMARPGSSGQAASGYEPFFGTGGVREASWLQPLEGLDFQDGQARGVEALRLPSLRDETPVVEEVENPAARIYHLRLPKTQQDEAVDVAWIIDPTLGG